MNDRMSMNFMHWEVFFGIHITELLLMMARLLRKLFSSFINKMHTPNQAAAGNFKAFRLKLTMLNAVDR